MKAAHNGDIVIAYETFGGPGGTLGRPGGTCGGPGGTCGGPGGMCGGPGGTCGCPGGTCGGPGGTCGCPGGTCGGPDETLGRPDGAPLLLISGTGAQMLIWPEDFCTALAGRGFQVARFDNRDTGLSTHLTGTPAPGLLKAMLRPSAAPYRLEDMAADALAVMDALGWPSAHIVGASLGGMIAQALAIRHPARVRTLTSIMSTPSARIATMPTVAAMRALARAAGTPVTRPDQAGEEAVALKRVIGSPGYPLDEPAVRDIGRRSFERHPGAEQDDLRQRAAIIASGDRRNALASLHIPALVLHGEQDPVIRPRGGSATAGAIPGARLVTYPGMGHDLPRALWRSILNEIQALAAQTATTATAARPV